MSNLKSFASALALSLLASAAHADSNFNMRINGYQSRTHCSHSIYGTTCATQSSGSILSGAQPQQEPVDMTPAPESWADKCGASCLDLSK